MTFDYDALVKQASLLQAQFTGWEAMTYKPSVGAPRSILGLAERQSPGASLPQTPGVFTTITRVCVLNDVVLGILRSELNTGGDILSFPSKVGDVTSIKDWEIVHVLLEDPGCLELEVR